MTAQNSRFGPLRSTLYGACIVVVFFVVVELLARANDALDVPEELSGLVEDGAFRIFVYGGSTAEGRPLVEYGFVRQLEYQLGQLVPDRKVQIVNFARAGGSSSRVRRKLDESIGYAPDLLVVLSGHNEFLDPTAHRTERGVLAEFAFTRAMSRFVRRMRERLAPEDPAALTYQNFVRGTVPFAAKTNIYEENIAYVVAEARAHEVPILLITAPANLVGWPPAFRGYGTPEQGARRESWFAQVGAMLQEGTTAAADRFLTDALARHPDEALLHFLAGRNLILQSRFDAARTALVRAKDLDPFPWRVLSEFNAAMRSYEGLPGVAVADAARLFGDRAPNGLVGFSLVADNCHPTLLGNAIIAHSVLAQMRRYGWMIAADVGLPDVDTLLARFIADTTTPQLRNNLDFEILLEHAKYAMKAPFHHYEVADEYLRKAMTQDEARWDIWANVATVSLLVGDHEEGREELARAEALFGGPLDLDDRFHTPYLKEALSGSQVRSVAPD